MPIQKSEGIILRKIHLRETSVILHIYTKDFGKINGIVRGVRGRGAEQGGGGLELFAHDEIVFYERKRGPIYTVSQFDLLDFFYPVRESLEKLSCAAYIIELLDSVTTLGDKNIEVFDLLLNSLKLMSGESSPKRVTRIFEIKLLHLLGLMPTLRQCVNCAGPLEMDAFFSVRHGGLVCKSCRASDRDARAVLQGTVKFIEHIRTSPFEKVARVKVASEVGKELEQILRRFLDFHIERRLKTVEFLKEIER